MPKANRPLRDGAAKSLRAEVSAKAFSSISDRLRSVASGKFWASQRPAVAIVFGISGVLFPLFVFNSPGTTDYSDWLRWLEILRDHGWVKGYEQIVAMYPPLGQGLLWAASLLGNLFDTSPFAGIKLVILISGYLSTALFWLWRKSASIPLCILWITSGVMLGYLDVLFVPALFLALWSMERGRYANCGLFYAIACFIKWQPLILGPFLFVYACKRKAALAFLVPIACISVGFYIVFGRTMISDLTLGFEQNLLSGNALNLPLLIDGVLRHFSFARIGGCQPQSPWDWQCLTRESAIGIYLLKAAFVGAYSCVLVSFIRRESSFGGCLRASLIGILAYFAISPGVHENHLFLGAVVALVYAQECQEERSVCFFVIAMAILNPILFYGLDGNGLPGLKVPHDGSITLPVILLAALAALVTAMTGRSILAYAFGAERAAAKKL